MRAVRERPCRSSSSRRSILPSWLSLSSSSSWRTADSSRYLLVTPLLAARSDGASSLGPSLSSGRSVISSLSCSLNGCNTFSTVNSAMYRFCFSRISSRLAAVKNSIQLARAILGGGRVLERILRLSSWLFSSLRLLSRESNCWRYSRLTSCRSPLLSRRTISRSTSKANLRTVSKASLPTTSSSPGHRSSRGRSRSSSRPKQRQKKSFSLHSKRKRCILVSQREGRYRLLYCRQLSSIRRFSRPDFSLSACSRSLVASLLPRRSSCDALFRGGFGAALPLFLTDSRLRSSTSSRSRSSFSSCSLNIFRISSWLMRLSDLFCTTCSSSPSPSSAAREFPDWKLGIEDIAKLACSPPSSWFSYSWLIYIYTITNSQKRRPNSLTPSFLTYRSEGCQSPLTRPPKQGLAELMIANIESVQKQLNYHCGHSWSSSALIRFKL